MPQHQTLNESLVEILGEIDIAGSPATVSSPLGGDAVGLDFTGQRVRFGIVVDLETDPSLRVEPAHAGLLDVEDRLLVIEQVAALWYGAALVPDAVRRRRSRR
ncbi:hypothetical protein [Glycomyces sp. NPDC047010]|uniref:hypothetical protein n=1 Tax=Glycomyces sp. NPDC047010 TaxID=3155023 RepID=UPI0033D790D3